MKQTTKSPLSHERSGDRRLVSGFLCLELEVERKLPTASGDQTHKGNLTRLQPALTADHFQPDQPFPVLGPKEPTLADRKGWIVRLARAEFYLII